MGQRGPRTQAAARGEVLYVDGRHIEHVAGGVIVSYFVIRRRKSGVIYEQAVGGRYFLSTVVYHALLKELMPAAVHAAISTATDTLDGLVIN